MLQLRGKAPTGRWERFLARRRELHLTQAQVAARLKVKQSHVSDLERMQTYPSWEELPEIAEFLATTPEELVVHIVKNFLPTVKYNRPVYRKLR